MIAYSDNMFTLETEHTSYLFRVTPFGHLEHIYYGNRIPQNEIEPLLTKRIIMHGSSVMYSTKDDTYCLDNIPLEWTGVGCGDYRQTPIEVKLADGTFHTDFVYESHEIVAGCIPMETLPNAYEEENTAQTLCIKLNDAVAGLQLLLYYTVFPAVDVISRRAVLCNTGTGAVSVRAGS
jgi:alpha-galactosidase